MTQLTLIEVARHPAKVLNHLDLSTEADRVSRLLGLHREGTHEDLFAANGRLLEKHQRGQVSTAETIRKLAGNLYTFDFPLAETEIRRLLISIYSVAQVELHLSDVCNESCKGCTFGFDDPDLKPPPVMFPFADLVKIAEMQPRAVLFVGGGEPLLYRDGSRHFAEAVLRLRELLPHAQFGLVTNGTLWPVGEWAKEFSWVRVSVDAATAATYAAFRGKPYFERAYTTVLRLLTDTTVPQVGAGFIFCAENIHEAAPAAAFFWDLLRHHPDYLRQRFNLQYRPLRRDPKDAGREHFPEAITAPQIEQTVREFEELAATDTALAHFLDTQTNWRTIHHGNHHQAVEFSRCDFSLISRIVRANGDVRPCCMRVYEPEFLLGNVLHESPETIVLHALYNAAYLRPGCDGPGCKLGKINHLIGQGVRREVRPSEETAVRENPFFG